MTTADYVAIAISPALVMLLVGSLVFFLIEVLYQGQYQGRLSYVFGLFVFAAVLVARISIQIGSERAAMFALPLGLATFVVLTRFVEHSTPWSPLINLTLLAVVWWCAHKLTWDCTLIDDDQDASGKGLLEQVGVDEADAGNEGGSRDVASAKESANELVPDGEPDVPRRRWWQSLTHTDNRPHSPGLWVVYFSLAALPLFGIGQHWIPAGDVGRRRYVFALLLVYVAAGLSLLVTTSFLGLRRYLRQRRLEMPAPMAANWIAIGAVLIALVMLLAALVPRPGAEYAISQVPWVATAPEGLSASRVGAGNDGPRTQDEASRAVADQSAKGDRTVDSSDESQSQTSAEAEYGGQQSDGSGGDRQQADSGEESGQSSSDQRSDGSDRRSEDRNESRRESEQQEAASSASSGEQQEGSSPTRSVVPQHADQPSASPRMPDLPVANLAGVLKLVFYVVLAVAAAVFLWRRRHQLIRAMADILRELRELWARLFGGGTKDAGRESEQPQGGGPRRRPFAEFRDPFASGEHRQLSPDELVRYTFEAFEAWAGERGSPRRPDQTPRELVRAAVARETPMYDPAWRLARLYGEVAYARGAISRASAEGLAELWAMMRAARLPAEQRA